MIYTCVMFLNEFDILDLRISEELSVIDKLIIVEANSTHSLKPKPLRLKNDPKYQHDKIEIVELVDLFREVPEFNENFQRDAAALCRDFEDDDVIIGCDIDEINRTEDIPEIVDLARYHQVIKIGMPMYYYKINLYKCQWYCPFAVTGKFLKESGLSLTELRNLNRHRDVHIHWTNGKHFSYMGGAEQVAYKIQSFDRTEFDVPYFTDVEKIKNRIKDGVDPFERIIDGDPDRLIKVDIDETYPKTILDNIDKWENYIEH